MSLLRPDGQGWKRNVVASLMLTSLVDAFSILVVYLLFSFSNSNEILYLSKDMELPQAASAQELLRSTVVRVEQGQYFIEDKLVNPGELASALVDLRKHFAKTGLGNDEEEQALTVQADRRIQFNLLNNVILAGSQAGYSDIKFAVISVR
jgi:biopolymer transport protein ExbD